MPRISNQTWINCIKNRDIEVLKKNTVLTVEYARQAKYFLKTINITPDYNEFAGEHTVTNQMLLNLIGWLKDV